VVVNWDRDRPGRVCIILQTYSPTFTSERYSRKVFNPASVKRLLFTSRKVAMLQRPAEL